MPIYTQNVTIPENPSEDFESRYYVYVYFDPVTHEPFYVGKGTGYRYRAHIRDVKKALRRGISLETPKDRKIAKILKTGVEPRIVFAYTNLTNEEACSKEQSLISHYGRINTKEGILYNLTDGGEGFVRVVRDLEIHTFTHAEHGTVNRTQYEMTTEFGLSPSQTSTLVSGSCDYAAGWSLGKFSRDAIRKNNQKATFVNGITGCVETLTQNEMVMKYDLPASEVCSVVGGNVPHTKWWFLEEVPEKYRELIDLKFTEREYHNSNTDDYFVGTPEGLREYDPKIKTMGKIYEVIRGNRNHVHGWFLKSSFKENPRGFRVEGYSPEVIKFENVREGVCFRGSRKSFAEYSGLGVKQIYKVVKERKRIKGWTVVHP